MTAALKSIDWEWSLWARQILAVMRLEMKKTFFARRGLWIYLLAAAPAVLFVGAKFAATSRASRIVETASIKPEQAAAITPGMDVEEVRARLGAPYSRFRFIDPDAPRARRREGGAGLEMLGYSDGHTQYEYRFRNGKLISIHSQSSSNLGDSNTIFATIFQLFYIRLAIFFGCVGVFMNLFRGELIDKSLHFYLLAPIRREVLLAAKYGAGLLATAVIFGLSTVVQLYAVYGDMPAAQATEFWARDGAGTLFAYFGVTILACAGYGAVFLAAGLLYKNPMIPAAVLLVWEGANVFLPATLKKISVIHYLQSLCPIPASPSGDISPPLRLLISITEPTPAPLAILGLLTVTLVVLALGAWQARRLEINYSAE